MPGSSLWLLPPKDHPLESILTSLISKTSSHFNSPHLFIPHVTLTSSISAASYSPDPQRWLDGMDLPAGDKVQIKFGKLASEDVFVRKLYITVGKEEGVLALGATTRRLVHGYEDDDRDKAKKWAAEEYTPHLSLLYHDCPKVSAAEIAEIEKLVSEAGVDLNGNGELGGWTGGRVVLVPTDAPIKEWAPIAEKTI